MKEIVALHSQDPTLKINTCEKIYQHDTTVLYYPPTYCEGDCRVLIVEIQLNYLCVMY